MAGLAVGVVAAWELLGWWGDRRRRRGGWRLARAKADERGKALLVVGEPDGEYPCGDVTVDIRPASACPRYVRASVEDLSAFHDKQFGAAFVSFVIEQVCDPAKALSELRRVADEVIVVNAGSWRLASMGVRGRMWRMHVDPAGAATFERLAGRRTCGSPTRYG